MSYIFLSHWPENFHRPLPLTSQAIAMAIPYFPQLGGKALLVKTLLSDTISYIIKFGEIKPVPRQKLCPSIHSAGRYFA